MDKAITTALLIIASMIMVIMLFNAVYPAVMDGGDAILSMSHRVEDRMRNQVVVIHAAAELDRDGLWQDNGNHIFEAFIWVKNTGNARITALDQLDVFFGPEGNFTRIPHQSNAGGSYPYWTWQVEDGTDWLPTTTLRLTIHYGAALSSGRYFIKVTTTSGVSAEYYVGL